VAPALDQQREHGQAQQQPDGRARAGLDGRHRQRRKATNSPCGMKMTRVTENTSTSASAISA
jgi:hypothetical protein